jgi:ACS family hexuronate transporter-like MFS transporter
MASTPTAARPLLRHPLEATEMLQSDHRWMIGALLFFATAINYLDRQILSLLKPILGKELHWTTNGNFGWINALFQDAYAFSVLFFGRPIARYGVLCGLGELCVKIPVQDTKL